VSAAATPARLVGLAACVLALAVSVGCRRPAKAATAEQAPSAEREPAAPERHRIEILAPGGEATAWLAPADKGYALVDRAGWPIGYVHITGGRVDALDRQGTPLCSARTTKDGFTLVDGDGASLLVGVEDADGVSLRASGVEVGRMAGGALTTEQGVLRSTPTGDLLQVDLDGARALSLRGFSHEGGVWLAWTRLSFPQRVAMMFLHAERL
jgi:hypothetical protein